MVLNFEISFFSNLFVTSGFIVLFNQNLRTNSKRLALYSNPGLWIVTTDLVKVETIKQLSNSWPECVKWSKMKMSHPPNIRNEPVRLKNIRLRTQEVLQDKVYKFACRNDSRGIIAFLQIFLLFTWSVPKRCGVQCTSTWKQGVADRYFFM